MDLNSSPRHANKECSKGLGDRVRAGEKDWRVESTGGKT